MGYNGTIELIAGVKPANNGNFPMVNAKDVYVDDDTRLDAKLNGLDDSIDDLNAAVVTDATLSQTGKPADAKAVGDAINNITIEVDATLSQTGKAADAKATGDAVADLKESIDEITQPKLVQISDETITGYYLSTLGNVIQASSSASSFEITDYVDVSGLSQVAITATGTSNRSYYAFFDAEKTVISGSNRVYETDVSLVDEIVNVPSGAKYCVAMIYKKTSVSDPIIKRIDAEVVIPDGSVTLEKVVPGIFVEKEYSKNLFDESAVTPNTIMDNNAVHTSANNAYNTSDFIPVKEGTAYTISPSSRQYCFSTGMTDNTVLVWNGDNTYSPRTVTAPADGYLRFSYSNTAVNVQVEEGTEVTSYVPYAVRVENDVHLSDAMKTDVSEVFADTYGRLAVSAKDGQFIIMSDYGVNSKLKRVVGCDPAYANGVFNFGSTYVVSNGTETEIKNSNDDIAPLRVGVDAGDVKQRTVGANHGWLAHRVPKGDLTTADIGSTWTDGTNNFILANVRGEQAYFIPQATYGNGTYTYSKTAPQSDLTHLSGATHTGTVSITGLDTNNLYPSVNQHFCKYYADGVEIKANGSFGCNQFVVAEQYNIMDFAAIGTYLASHIGSFTDDDNIDGCITVSLTYIFSETSCCVLTAIELLKSVKLRDCGMVQSMALKYPGKTIYRYINGVASGHTFASSTVVDISNYSTGINISNTDLSDPTIPTNRCVDLVKDNGEMIYGFAFGYIPDFGAGANAERAGNSQVWNLRDTKKSYPTAIYNETEDAGYYTEVAAYRNYLRPGLDITNASVIELGESAYVIIDAHTQINNYAIAVPDTYFGKTITALESANLTLKSNVVGTKGVVVSTSGSYGCAVLKIS